jgi:PilZ domain
LNLVIPQPGLACFFAEEPMTTEPVRVERRAGQRFDLHIPVSVKLSGTQHEVCGFTQDLSARGSFFYTDFPLGPAESVELTLNMPSEISLGEAMRVRCQGSVLRVVQPSIGTKLGVAVHFTGYEYLPADQAETPDSFARISALHGHPADDESPAMTVRRATR